jgi:hypothetical protein
MKTCIKCNIEKSEDNFTIRKSNGAHRGECKSCNADFSKKYRKENSLKIRYQRLISVYNITQEQLKEFESISNCEICNVDITGKWEKTGRYGKQLLSKRVLDHDHETGMYRGALCKVCNKALGAFKDDVNILSNAIKYLNK